MDARAARQPAEEVLRHINEALQLYQQALELTPSDAVYDLAVMHNQLGNIYNSVDDCDHALPHYRDAIYYFEATGALYNAAVSRFNVAGALHGAGRLADAQEYAYAALRNFETFGGRATEMIRSTQRLIEEIEQDLKAQGG